MARGETRFEADGTAKETSYLWGCEFYAFLDHLMVMIQAFELSQW